MAIGRPAKYFFLIERLNDRELYCPATIARLLTNEDVRKRKNIKGTLKEVRPKIRMSLARVARKYQIQPCGFVSLGQGNSGNKYPAYSGEIWKMIFQRHRTEKQKAKTISSKFA